MSATMRVAIVGGEDGECPDCEGWGHVRGDECPRCGGYGELKYVNPEWREDPREWDRRHAAREDADDNRPLGLKARLAS